MTSASAAAYRKCLPNLDPTHRVLTFCHLENYRPVYWCASELRTYHCPHRLRRQEAVSASLFQILSPARRRLESLSFGVENRPEIEVHHNHHRHRRRPKAAISNRLLSSAFVHARMDGAAHRQNRHRPLHRRQEEVSANVWVFRKKHLAPPHASMPFRA